jgi:hypothetical protein
MNKYSIQVSNQRCIIRWIEGNWRKERVYEYKQFGGKEKAIQTAKKTIQSRLKLIDEFNNLFAGKYNVS